VDQKKSRTVNEMDASCQGEQKRHQNYIWLIRIVGHIQLWSERHHVSHSIKQCDETAEHQHRYSNIRTKCLNALMRTNTLHVTSYREQNRSTLGEVLALRKQREGSCEGSGQVEGIKARAVHWE
jgi:hypothetical protein